MKRGLIALLTAVFLAGVGTARAAIVTNAVQDFTLGTYDAFNLSIGSSPANNEEFLGGLAENRWVVANNVVTTNAWGKFTIKSNKNKPRVGFYTITADQFSGANPNAQLQFTLDALQTDGTLEVGIYSIQNPGTAGNAVQYDVLGGGGESLGNGVGLTASGSASVSMLVSTSYVATGTNTISFAYNGTDDIVLAFNSIGTEAANKTATIDDVVVTTDDSVSFPAAVSLVPADELYVGDIAGVTTGAVAVSYSEGSAATNVTITSVSVIEQTHAASFANVNTNLPLTLASPGTPEDLFIEFDNATAGLAAGQTATGIVEVVWNEVGSETSSTSTVPVSATNLEVNDSNTIAIFDHRSANASPRLGGLVATLSGYHNINSTQGSTDGTYGTLAGNARTDGGGVQASLNNPVISMAITNNTGYNCTFESLHFDAAKMFNKGLLDVSVSISGDVDSSTLTNYSGLTQFGGVAGDYDDFDIDLTGLSPDPTLAHGEAVLIEFTFSNGDPSNSNAVSVIDNIALLGSGQNGANLTKLPGGWVSMGISGLDTGASELIEMSYTEGDAETNVVITGVTFSGETHPGAFSYTGLLPLELATAEATNSIVTLLFDNTVANIPADDYANAIMEITWNEVGLSNRVFEVDVYATRAADVPTNGVIALLDTEFLTADAAVNGVKAVMGGLGSLQYDERGSEDQTYGSISTNMLTAPTTTSMWQINGTNNVATLTITNTTVADIELSTFNFDIGRWYPAAADEFTLSVSGDVTDTPALLVSNLTVLGFQVYDFDDIDVDLTGLADHTLSSGESLVFTISLTPKEGSTYYNVWIDNIALMGDFNAFGGWAASYGIPGGQDGPYANPDGDNKDNLMEYATGGDPMVADGSAAAIWQAEEGGSNWMYHVHAERQDDAGLSYDVGASSNLLWDTMHTELVEEVGATTGPGLWNTVTNRTLMDLDSKFIGLEVEQN